MGKEDCQADDKNLLPEKAYNKGFMRKYIKPLLNIRLTIIMRKITLFIVFILFCTVSLAQVTNTLDKWETVYKDENVTFRKIDDNTWIGSGNVMSSESLYLLAGNNSAVLIDAGTTIPGLNMRAEKDGFSVRFINRD